MAVVLAGLAVPAPVESAEPAAPTTRLMTLITWTEFREWAPGRIRTVLLPIGSIEAHGVIPNGSDAIAPTAMAEAIAPRLDAMVAPTLSHGVTPGLQAYPGAVSITPAATRRPTSRRAGVVLFRHPRQHLTSGPRGATSSPSLMFRDSR
jgi:creatinine amidohydrolase